MAKQVSATTALSLIDSPTAFPTTAQLASYGGSGPWPSANRADQLRNVGYAEGRAAVASLNKVGWNPGVVWIDVEPRPAQPWPSSTSAQKQENRYVITGLMRALDEAGYDGWIGAEYTPLTSTEAGLRWLRSA